MPYRVAKEHLITLVKESKHQHTDYCASKTTRNQNKNKLRPAINIRRQAVKVQLNGSVMGNGIWMWSL